MSLARTAVFVTVPLLYWKSIHLYEIICQSGLNCSGLRQAGIIQQSPWMRNKERGTLFLNESATRGLKQAVWNEKERDAGLKKKKKEARMWKWEKGLGYPQRKCLFDSLAAKLLTAGKCVPDRMTEHQRASVQLLLLRRENPKRKRLNVTLEPDIPHISGIWQFICFNNWHANIADDYLHFTDKMHYSFSSEKVGCLRFMQNIY